VRHARKILTGFAKSVREISGLTVEGFLQTMEKFNKAFAAMENMEWKKAINGFQEVLAVHPKHTQSYGNLGICYANLGRKKEALAALDKALRLDPNYGPALMNREIIRSLAEGETLTSAKFASVDYYKDITLKERS
jgi:tetratricopeptide (TPR) repeat protein